MSLPDDLKARLRLNDTSLWLVSGNAPIGQERPHGVAETDAQGGLTYLCDMTLKEWVTTPGPAVPGGTGERQDIHADSECVEEEGLHWVVPPPWLDT